jgi:hypothetical protein
MMHADVKSSHFKQKYVKLFSKNPLSGIFFVIKFVIFHIVRVLSVDR